MTPDESRIWSLISASARGRRQAVSVRDLTATTGLSDRMVRKIVKALIEVHSCPIASSPQPPAGYFVPEALPEIMESLDGLKGRAMSILVRMSRLRRTTLRDTIDQLRMDLREDAA